MVRISSSKAFLRELPDVPKRLWDIMRHPDIPVGRTSGEALITAMWDLILVTAVVDSIIVAGAELLPGLLDIEPEKLIHWWMFRALLILTGVVYALLCYGFLLAPLLLKSRHSHVQLICHILRAYSVANILVTILFVISINRVVAKSSIVDPTSPADLTLGLCVATLMFWLTMRSLVNPIGRYIKHHFRIPGTSFLALAVVIVASILNPVLAPRYFAHIIEEREFCYQVVLVRFRKELDSGEYSKDCLVARCVAGVSHESQHDSAHTLRSCPNHRVAGAAKLQGPNAPDADKVTLLKGQ